jgi:hypothetical protein
MRVWGMSPFLSCRNEGDISTVAPSFSSLRCTRPSTRRRTLIMKSELSSLRDLPPSSRRRRTERDPPTPLDYRLELFPHSKREEGEGKEVLEVDTLPLLLERLIETSRRRRDAAPDSVLSLQQDDRIDGEALIDRQVIVAEVESPLMQRWSDLQ